MPILEVEHVQKVYSTRFGGQKVQALADVSFTVERGEYVAIMGESGSGKTTLLNILAALDKPTAGSVVLDGMDLSRVREGSMAAFRRDNLGFVFQNFSLLDTFSLRDNILLPLVPAGKKYPEMEERLKPLAEELGIAGLLDKYPYEVSGGQKQRCAVARALITGPKLVLADEPTGALDSRSSEALTDLFVRINRAGQTVPMVTYSAAAASRAGLSQREVRASIRSQVLIVFFLPIAVACVHILFDFNLVARMLTMFGVHSFATAALCTAGTVPVFSAVYTAVYLFTARTYYKIVK